MPDALAALAEARHTVALVGEFGGGEARAIGGVGEARVELEVALAVNGGAKPERGLLGRGVVGDDLKLSREVA